jgi:hypothetical protein
MDDNRKLWHEISSKYRNKVKLWVSQDLTSHGDHMMANKHQASHIGPHLPNAVEATIAINEEDGGYDVLLQRLDMLTLTL